MVGFSFPWQSLIPTLHRVARVCPPQRWYMWDCSFGRAGQRTGKGYAGSEVGKEDWVWRGRMGAGEALTRCKPGQSWGVNTELKSRSWRWHPLRSGQQRSAGCGEGGKMGGTNIVLFGIKPLGYLWVIPSSFQWCPWKPYPVALQPLQCLLEGVTF